MCVGGAGGCLWLCCSCGLPVSSCVAVCAAMVLIACPVTQRPITTNTQPRPNTTQHHPPTQSSKTGCVPEAPHTHQAVPGAVPQQGAVNPRAQGFKGPAAGLQAQRQQRQQPATAQPGAVSACCVCFLGAGDSVECWSLDTVALKRGCEKKP